MRKTGGGWEQTGGLITIRYMGYVLSRKVGMVVENLQKNAAKRPPRRGGGSTVFSLPEEALSIS